MYLGRVTFKKDHQWGFKQFIYQNNQLLNLQKKTREMCQTFKVCVALVWKSILSTMKWAMNMSTVICSMPSAIVSKDLRLSHMDMLVKNDQLDLRDNLNFMLFNSMMWVNFLSRVSKSLSIMILIRPRFFLICFR